MPAAENLVPLTPGRDIGFDTRWNAWAEVIGTSLSDRRYGLSTNNRSGQVTFGLDYKATPDVVVGFSFGLQSGRGDGFNGNMHSDSNGFNIGPYVAIRLSPNWAIDASFDYTQIRSDVQIVMLNGSATLRSYTGSLNLHGQYTVDGWFLRPKFSISYSYNASGARDLRGTFLGLPLTLSLAESGSNYGLAEVYGEVSRLFEISNGTFMIPYAELGLHYEFERANGGQILTGDLSFATPVAWTGSLRAGVRMQLPNAALVEAGVGYLSFGQPGLDVWEAKLRLSLGF